MPRKNDVGSESKIAEAAASEEEKSGNQAKD
jgi:hypothetical protein